MGPLGQFDSQPLLTRGCDGLLTGGCWIFTPYVRINNDVRVSLIENEDSNTSDRVTSAKEGVSVNLSSLQFITYATFTPTPVPLPASAFMLGAGLAGLFGLRRRGQNRAKSVA